MDNQLNLFEQPSQQQPEDEFFHVERLVSKPDVDLRLGNCIDVMRSLEDGIIDLTVTSPPYDNLRTYKDTLVWDWWTFQQIARELYRTTKEGGVVVWVVGDATIKGSETGSSFQQALYFKECGFWLFDTMIWEKASRIPTQDRYYNVVEYMFVFSKGKPKALNFIVDHKNVTAGARKKKDKCINKGANVKSDKYLVIGDYSRRSNIWRYGTAGNGTEHLAIFPEKLAHDHIVTWSNKGDVVFDPFTGSGTTGKMAMQTGRAFIGCEIVPEYYEMATKRIEAC